MNRRWNKNIYRGLLLLSFLAINALLLFGISSVWHYLNSGADRSSMLHLSTDIDAAYAPQIQWESTQNEGRPMEDQTLRDISKDYKNAWYFRNRAFAHNTTSGLEDYFTKPLKDNLEKYVGLNIKNSTKIRQTTLVHHPKLEYYSADGKIVEFTDHQVRSYEKVYREDQLIYTQEKVRSYRVIMILEDGFWRIRQMAEIPNTHNNQESQKQIGMKMISEIKGINYYPQQHPWAMFDENFDPQQIETDFSRINTMGLNSVRIFVPYSDFGGANVQEAKLSRLLKVLDLAKSQNLKVLVTLFDFYGNYELEDWTLTHRHAEIIVNSLKNHHALLGWDIKNEPDLDFKTRGRDNVLAWVSEMRNQIKSWDKEHPVTIGWSNPEVAITLSNAVDFVSFHYYRSPVNFATAYSKLKKQITNKPIILEEYGSTSYSGIWNFFSNSNLDQANYFEKMQTVLKSENLPYMAWTLFDFEQVPKQVIGSYPWRKQPQKYYGLIDTEGKKKKAYKTFLEKQ